MKKSIWFISKYASPPHSSGGQRGFSLAKAFVEQGNVATVIASSANHFGVFSAEDWTRIGNHFSEGFFDGVPVFVHRSLSYKRTASLRRVLSWIHFEWGLLFLPHKRIPTPTHWAAAGFSDSGIG
jgi:hypothetical protein